MGKYIVQYETPKRWVDAEGEYQSIGECYEVAGKLFDNDIGSDYRIKEMLDNEVLGYIELYPYQFVKEPCKICGKEVRHHELVQTRDCHGIPYRYVCPDCYDKVMSKGFDGEYYTEADENF